MLLPDFFIVGAPKCGTTTLYHWLKTHPEVHAPHKEPGFFSQDIYPTHHLPTHIPSLEAYCDIFRPTSPEQLISGEATPRYLYSDQALERIAALCPDARIIVCLRNPVDLVISFHNQKLREGKEREIDFARAWSRSVSVGGDQIVSFEPTVNGRINYAFWGAIGRRLETLFRRFPPENIRIYTLQDLESTPEETFCDLCDFLGISTDHRISPKVANPGQRLRSAHLHLAAVSIRRAMQPALRRLPIPGAHKGTGLLRLLQRFNHTTGGYDRDVAPELRAQIGRLLAEECAIAERFLDGRLLSREHYAEPRSKQFLGERTT